MADKLRIIDDNGKLKIFYSPLENNKIKDAKSFIMGKKSFWHNGVHLSSFNAVHSICSGEIVAYRFMSEFKTSDYKIKDELEEDYLGRYGIADPEKIELLKNYYNLNDGIYKLKPEYAGDRHSIPYETRIALYKLFNAVYSNSFLLLRHKIYNYNNDSDIVFYSLYNHLRPLKELTNQEKSSTFIFVPVIKIQKVKNAYIQTENPFSGSIINNPIKKVFIDTPISYERKYYRWKINGKEYSGFVCVKDCCTVGNHKEIKRPKTKEEIKNAKKYSDKYFLYDDSEFNNRNVVRVINSIETVNVDRNDFIQYIKDNNEKKGLKVSYENACYYIYFVESALKRLVDKYKNYTNKFDGYNLDTITYNLNIGFTIRTYNRNSADSTIILSFSENDTVSAYIEAYDGNDMSNKQYMPKLEIPCETVITESKQPNSVEYEYVSTSIPDLKFEGYVKKENIKDNKILKGKQQQTSVSEILVYSNDDYNNRIISDVVPLNTEFTVKNFEVLSDLINQTVLFSKGISVSYLKNKKEYSGYVFLNFTNEDNKSIHKRFKEWLTEIDSAKTNFADAFLMELKPIRKIDKIVTDDNSDLSGNTVIGYTGYPMIYGKDSSTVTKYYETKLHFEIFMEKDIMLQNFNPLKNYNSNLKIKKKTIIHYDQPVTRLINKPVIFKGKTISGVLDGFAAKLSESIKIPGVSAKIKTDVVNNLVNDNSDVLKECYFKATGNTVCLVEGESFTEIQVLGEIRKMKDSEYIRRSDFDDWNPSEKYWSVKSDKKDVHIYDTTGKETEDTVTLYKDYNYYECKDKDYKELNLDPDILSKRFRRCEFLYIKTNDQPKFYVKTELLRETFCFGDLYVLGYDSEYRMKIEGKEIYLCPTAITWKNKGEEVSSGNFVNKNKTIKDEKNIIWRKTAKDEDSKIFVWLKETDISSEIDTDMPIEEVIYNKWEQFYTKIENLEDFGKYRCEKGNEEKLLEKLGIPFIQGTVDHTNVCDTMINKRELLASFYLFRDSEWKTDNDLTKLYGDCSSSIREAINQKRIDYCFGSEVPVLKKKNYYFHPIAFLNHLDKVATPMEFNPYITAKILVPYNNDISCNPGFMPKGITTDSFTQPFNKPYPSGYWHEGVDIAISKGTPIISGINGTVVFMDDKQNYSYGCFIIIQAKELYNGKCKYYLLGHLDRTKEYKKVGESVLANEIVGYVGNTGHCGTSYVPKSEWNELDYSYGNGNLIGNNHLNYRAKGYGAHLHLQMYLSEDLNFTKFIQNHGLITSTEEQSIPLNNMEIVNAFNYMETYKNEK